MCNDDVFVSIFIQVRGDYPHVCFRSSHSVESATTLECALFEGPIFLIQPEKIRHAVIGHEKILPPVAIEIRGDYSESRPLAAQKAGGSGDVFKCAIASVAPEAV